MDKIPLISLIFYSYPESLVLISLGSALYGYNVKENYKKILLYGLFHTIAAYFIRALSFPFGAILALQIVTYIFLTSLILRLSLLRAVFIVLTGYIGLQVSENIVLPLTLKVLGSSFDAAIKDPLLRLVIGWALLSPLALLTFFIIWKKISFIPAFNLFEPKTPGGKMVLWLVSLILIQAVIGLTINLVFYNNFFRNTAGPTIFESAWISKLLEFLLVILPIISIFMIGKLFNLVEKENIIASQEAFIENVNNLFNTIRAQRHDFINHVQVLNSYINMNLAEAAKVYMANIIHETIEIDEILAVDDPVLTTLIQAKIGIAQQYKISFEPDIQSALTDLNIKPFDLVKIIGTLINNAIEAVKDLDRESRKVRLTLKKQNHFYMIEVFYPQPVIPPNVPGKSFGDSFYAKTSLEHCSADLAAIKKVIQKYKGTVTVRSFEAEMTAFIVTLPEN